jgi:uncharacterized protein YodC (DUF2158 family)
MAKARRGSGKSKLKVGARVRLNSGGPTMTLDVIDKGQATCVWFIKQEQKSRKFSLASLTRADAPSSMKLQFVLPRKRPEP